MTTLLAVDDSNTMRKALEITFAGEDDFETVLAASADEALRLLDERRPEIALIDNTLGDSDVYALCERVKQGHPGTRIILLSSKQHPYDPKRGVAVGIDDHLDKPFDTQVLIERTRSLAQATAAVVQPIAVQPVGEPSAPELEIVEVIESVPPAVEATEERRSPTLEFPQPLSQPPVEIQAAPAPTPEPLALEPIAQPVAAAPAPAAIVAQAATVAQAAATNGAASLGTKLEALGLSSEQVTAVLALSRDIIEHAVWEVVPTLAETLIKEEIARLTKE